jgi:hypothetical protein
VPTIRRGSRAARALAASLALVALALGHATAQAGFRVTHAVGRSGPTHVEVTGTVTNEARAEVVDVSVTVEALGPGGKVLARGVTFVTNRLPTSSTASFTAKVPAAPGVVSYRAAVTSYRFMQVFGAP